MELPSIPQVTDNQYVISSGDGRKRKKEAKRIIKREKGEEIEIERKMKRD